MHVLVVDKESENQERMVAWIAFLAELESNIVCDTTANPDPTVTGPTVIFAHDSVWEASRVDAFLVKQRDAGKFVEAWTYSAKPDHRLKSKELLLARKLIALPNAEPLFGDGSDADDALVGLSERLRWLASDPNQNIGRKYPSWDDKFELVG